MDHPGEMADLLGENGPFAGLMEGFRPRQAQQHMADAVHEAIENQSRLMVEAGTGVGKTFAYLVPALTSGRRVIISTGTRHLQDQLFLKDIPHVERVLGTRVYSALLKGRANYLCHYRLENVLESGFIRSPDLLQRLARIRDWGAGTRTGDIAEIPDVPEGDSVWPMVTSTADNCLGSDCPFYQECHVVAARRQAQEADVVVVNHHLFLADLALKEEGFGEILPSADAFVLDEAHQLPEIAARFFGRSTSSRQLRELARDVSQAHLREAPDMPDLRDRARQVELESDTFRQALARLPRRESWQKALGTGQIANALEALNQSLDSLETALEAAAARGKELENLHRRCAETRARLAPFAEAGEGEVTWFEHWRDGFRLSATPLEVAGPFREYMERYASAWIFTSATMAVGDDFSYFSRRLGVEEAETLRLESPFNYRDNAILYLPPDLPQPSHPSHTGALVERVRPVLEATGGGAFLLFTSYRALHEAAEQLEALDLEYPLLVQGRAGKRELIERFRESGDAVLLGTQSFWEGVDVRGHALRCVVIDKLPFASPADPVLKARLDAIEQGGGSPFFDYQIPQAVITLKQGVGRLIRDMTDRGILVLGDPRIRARGYGLHFLNGLPPMTQTDSLERIQAFAADLRE